MLLLLLHACTGPKDSDTRPPADDSVATTDSDVDPLGPPLVIVVLTDDLGDNMYPYMTATTARLEPVGRRFTKAYTTVPNCCPARASFFSEAYPSETGVESNSPPTGGYFLFDDTTTLATRLQGAGVTTAIFGKYLNGYETDPSLRVPPGWDQFVVPTMLGDFTDTTLFTGSSTPTEAGTASPTDTGGEYLTTWLFEQALTFLDEHPDEPTFLLLTPQSPHAEGTPAAEDLGTYADFEWRPPSYAEEDVSDKPSFLRNKTVTDEDLETWDARTEWMMENQASLDRAMAAFYDGLDSRGLLDRATLIFTSDNGMLHGEHRIEDKGLPYEEAVHVPMVVVQRGLSAGDDDRMVAINLDIPATALELNGVEVSSTDAGASLQPLFDDDSAPGRDHIFLETSIGGHPVWAGVVTDRWKYVELGTGESELYDLDADPYELESLHAAPPEAADLSTLVAETDEHRSLAITTTGLPPCGPGTAYSARLAAWGGQGTLTWTLDDGVLPDGLSVSADGEISGTTTETGTFAVTLGVTDSATSPLTGAHRRFSAPFTVTVGAAMEAVAHRNGKVVHFEVPAHPGARVAVSVTADDSWDTHPWRSAETVAGEGPVALELTLDPRRTWHWRAEIDGVVVPMGRIAAKR